MHDPPFLCASFTQKVLLPESIFKRDVLVGFEVNPRDSSETVVITFNGQARARKRACLPSKMTEPIGAPPARSIVITEQNL